MTRALLLCYNIHCVQRQQALSHQHNGLSACRECDLKMIIFSDCSPLLLNAEDFLFSEVKSKMANANVINEKAAVVAALVERLNGAQSGVIVDYSGLTVAEDTELRSAMRKEGVEYAVVKNTMMRRALDSVGLEALDEKLHGTTSLATGTEDPIAPIRLVADYSKKLGDKFNLKAAFMEGKVLSDAEVAVLSTMTSKKDVYAQLVGTLLAPVANLSAVMAAIAEKGEAAAE